MLAISVDNLEEASEVVQMLGIPFPILYDPSTEAPQSYKVFNLLGDGLATPSTFVLDKEGVITWKYIARSIGDRPSVSTILAQLSGLEPTFTLAPTDVAPAVSSAPTDRPPIADPVPTDTPPVASPVPVDPSAVASPVPTEPPPVATPVPTEPPATATPLPTEIPIPVGTSVGELAPAFMLPSISGSDVSLESYRGDKNLVVVFYRAFW